MLVFIILLIVAAVIWFVNGAMKMSVPHFIFESDDAGSIAKQLSVPHFQGHVRIEAVSNTVYVYCEQSNREVFNHLLNTFVKHDLKVTTFNV